MNDTSGGGPITWAEQELLSSSDRNNTLNYVAGFCFRLAHGGQLDPGEVQERMAQAARDAGLERHEIKATLRSEDRYGQRHPLEGREAHEASPPRPAVEIPLEPPVYPPPHVWTALWEAADGVFLHDEACRWLEGRGVDLERLSGARLCRYLPKGATFPPELTAEIRTTVPKVAVDGEYKHAPLYGFRLLFRLYDSLGYPRSLSLRCIVDHGDRLPTKAVPLKPQKRGLVLANRWGVAVLQRDPARKTLWGDRLVQYVLVEGEPDFLAASSEDTGDDGVRVVFGITGGGSWTDAHAIAIPQDAHVIIATDDDGPGDRYAAKIKDTLRGRRRPCVRFGDDCS